MSKIKSYVFSYIGVSLLGIVLGVFASFVNQQSDFLYNSFLGVITATFGYWVIFGSCIALNSKSALKAAINCFLFFLFMNLAFYAYDWFITGTLQTGYLIRWLIVTAATPIGGYLVFYVKQRNWLGVVAASLPICFLGYECYEILFKIADAERIIKIDDVFRMVPTTAWIIANDIIKVLIYLGFAIYLLCLFPKTKRRVLWLVASIIIITAMLYLVFVRFNLV